MRVSKKSCPFLYSESLYKLVWVTGWKWTSLQCHTAGNNRFYPFYWVSQNLPQFCTVISRLSDGSRNCDNTALSNQCIMYVLMYDKRTCVIQVNAWSDTDPGQPEIILITERATRYIYPYTNTVLLGLQKSELQLYRAVVFRRELQ